MSSLRDWLQRYLDFLEREQASPYTIKNYGSDIAQFLEYCDTQHIHSPSDLHRDLIRDYLAELARLEYVRASIARRVFELRAFGDFLLRNEVWQQNVFRQIYAPRLPQKVPRYLTLVEVEALLQVADLSTPFGLRDQAILEVLYASGVRISELANLDLRDVDLDAGELRVIGKGDKERVALLGKPAVAALKNYLIGGRPQLAAQRPSNAVFLNRFGQRLSVRSIDEVVRQAGVAAGIRQTVTPHLLRHTFATHLLDGGADLRVVQELLGHEALATTQIYANVTQQRAREIYLKSHPRSHGAADATPKSHA